MWAHGVRVPLSYRRPDPAATAVARTRLEQLSEPESARPSAANLWPTPTAADLRMAAQAGLPPTGPPPELAERLDPPRPAVPSRLAVRWSQWLDGFVPASLRGARLDPGRRGVAALAAVAVLAAAVAGIGVWRSRPRAVEVTAPPVVTARPSALHSSNGPTVVVAVAGGVRRPGVITLPSGARVADAVKAAGGVRTGVDVGLLNLARRLVDGEQVVVGASAAPGGPAGPGPPAAGPAGSPISLNTATAEQLDGLPGVGPVLAARIVTYRTQHGGFRSVDQLREVTGIGEAKYADLKSLVSV